MDTTNTPHSSKDFDIKVYGAIGVTKDTHRQIKLTLSSCTALFTSRGENIIVDLSELEAAEESPISKEELVNILVLDKNTPQNLAAQMNNTNMTVVEIYIR